MLSQWLDMHAPKPAEPLPAEMEIEDSPIYREGGVPLIIPD